MGGEVCVFVCVTWEGRVPGSRVPSSQSGTRDLLRLSGIVTGIFFNTIIRRAVGYRVRICVPVHRCQIIVLKNSIFTGFCPKTIAK